jgi:RNA polymerase sigma-70 factor (ECF subfamily)
VGQDGFGSTGPIRRLERSGGCLRAASKLEEKWAGNEPFGPEARITRWRWKLADDREVWERICRGDARAFDAFYREHGPRLQAFLRQILGNRQAAEDVMQETFTQIWRRPNGFAPERGTLRAYLFGAGRRRAAEWWRKQDQWHPATGEPAASNTETSSLVGDAFSRLVEEQRTLIWLREIEGRSYAELAEILEIPVGTVRSRLHAAREELRKVWHATRAAKKEGQ